MPEHGFCKHSGSANSRSVGQQCGDLAAGLSSLWRQCPNETPAKRRVQPNRRAGVRPGGARRAKALVSAQKSNSPRAPLPRLRPPTRAIPAVSKFSPPPGHNTQTRLAAHDCALGRGAHLRHSNAMKTYSLIAAFALLTACTPFTSPQAGRNIYLQNCASCHGADGQGGAQIPDLTQITARAGGTPSGSGTSAAGSQAKRS